MVGGHVSGGRPNGQDDIIVQYTKALKEIARLNDPSLLIKYSKKWLEKTRNPKAVRSTMAMIFYADITSTSAAKAYDYEYQKLIRGGIFNPSFFEASLQSIKAYSMEVIASGQRDLGKIIQKSAIKYRKHNRIGPLDKGTIDEISIQKRDKLIDQLGGIVELAFDAEKFKHSFGSDVSQQQLGEGVFENKERYAQDVMDEFRKVIKYMAMSENLKPLLEEIANHITKTKENVIEAATKSNNNREKIIANLVHQTLLQVVTEERAAVPIYAALTSLSIFAPASNFEARLGGAETQEYEDEILHLIGEYMGLK
jgi:hypothetical protein